MSFLQRLKGQGIDTSSAEGGSSSAAPSEEQDLKGVAEVAVDLYETDSDIVIYAPVPGADINDTKVSIEGDNDVVVLHGEKKRPESMIYKDGQLPEGRYFSQDAQWGEFYRRIILPEPIDVKRAKVQMKNGILVMVLPTMKTKAPETHTLTIEKVVD